MSSCVLIFESMEASVADFSLSPSNVCEKNNISTFTHLLRGPRNEVCASVFVCTHARTHARTCMCVFICVFVHVFVCVYIRDSKREMVLAAGGNRWLLMDAHRSK